MRARTFCKDWRRAPKGRSAVCWSAGARVTACCRCGHFGRNIFKPTSRNWARPIGPTQPVARHPPLLQIRGRCWPDRHRSRHRRDPRQDDQDRRNSIRGPRRTSPSSRHGIRSDRRRGWRWRSTSISAFASPTWCGSDRATSGTASCTTSCRRRAAVLAAIASACGCSRRRGRLIAATPVTGTETYLVTSFGKAFTANGFGNKMRQWCDEAELPDCTSHETRKLMMVRLAHAGYSAPQIGRDLGSQGSARDPALHRGRMDRTKMAIETMTSLSNWRFKERTETCKQ